MHDKICAFPIKKKNHKIFFKCKFSKNIPRINTIQKTLKLLEKEGLLKKKLYVIVYKNIPQKSGLGGGSMNSASLIKLLIKKKIVKINNDKLTNISDKIGDDVKIGFKRNLIYLDIYSSHLDQIYEKFMSVKINYSKKSSAKYLNNLIIFSDDKFGLNKIKKFLSTSEFSYINDLIKNSDLKKNLLVFELNSKKKIVLISIKNNFKTSEI